MKYDGKSLYEYWKRFKQLCTSCPHHQIGEKLFIQDFNERLLTIERSIVGSASRGSLVDKTLDEVRRLISTMAINSQ